MNLENESTGNEIQYEKPVKRKRHLTLGSLVTFALAGPLGEALLQDAFDVSTMKDSHLKDEYDCREREGKNYFKYTRGVPDEVFIREMIRRGFDES